MHEYAQNVSFGLFAAGWLFGLTGWFHIHLFYLSKGIVRVRMKEKGYHQHRSTDLPVP